MLKKHVGMRPLKNCFLNDRFLTDYHHWPVYLNGLALYHTCRFFVHPKKYGFRQYYTDNVALSDTGGIFSQLVQISSSEALLQLTKLSPTVATAPNSTGTATQMS